MELIFIKILVSIIVVIGIVFISERSPKIGGLLAGLPLGVGILMFFYALEHGTTFTITGIPYAIAGLTSSLVFGMSFYLGGKLFPQNKTLHTSASVFCGILGFFISGFLISLVTINLTIGLGIFLIGMILSILFFNTVSESKKVKLQKNTFSALLFRTLLVTAVVLTITGTAKILGFKWAGIMASFPTMLCPVLIILAYNYKDELYPNVLKHFSYSITTLVVYYLLILMLYPKYGIYSGTFIAYLICFMYLYTLNRIGLFIETKTKNGQQLNKGRS